MKNTPTKPTKARISRVWIERKRQRDEVGVIAKASIVSNAGVRQTLCSGGCWYYYLADARRAIDNDNGELINLRSELASFGFGTRAIDYAMKNVERKEMP